jgi:hypothetical protein
MYEGQTKITSRNILYLTGIGSLKFLVMCEQFPANCIIRIFQVSYEILLETIKQSNASLLCLAILFVFGRVIVVTDTKVCDKERNSQYSTATNFAKELKVMTKYWGFKLHEVTTVTRPSLTTVPNYK